MEMMCTLFNLIHLFIYVSFLFYFQVEKHWIIIITPPWGECTNLRTIIFIWDTLCASFNPLLHINNGDDGFVAVPTCVAAMATGFNETPRGVQVLQFDPDKHPHCALKAFNDFIEQYEFRYKAQYTYPPKHAIDNEVAIWKSKHDNADPMLINEKPSRIHGSPKTRCWSC